MTHALRISQAVVLAWHLLILLAAEPGRLVQTRTVAEVLQASADHLAKVMQRLAKQGLVTTTRGPKGGVVLARPPEEISLLQVYEAIDGPFRPGNCLLERRVCDGASCILGSLVRSINRQLRDYLARTTVADAAAKNSLSLPPGPAGGPNRQKDTT